jgi:tRNA/tmRNA/rRNA uracil-C5-methylase (TrmA/RlmC/RlmD family)
MLRSGFTSEPEQHSRKPAPWMADWLRAWVPPGGLVLDLYAGLGSVPEAVVMAREGRRYIGAEIDEDRHAAALAIVRRASL